MATSTYNCPQFDPKLETVVEFIERFKMQCSDLLEQAGEDEKKKATVLIKALPVNVITDLQRRIKPVKLSAATYSELESKLTLQYEIKKSVVGAAVQFLNRKQSASESIENYAKILNDLASSCKYSECCRDRMLRDTFVSGLYSSKILSGLLQDCETKSFNECVEKAKLLEQITFDAQDIKLDPNTHHSFKVSESSSKSASVSSSYICIRCGAKGKHLVNNCFAINLDCNKCGKKGHIARVCKSVHKIHNMQCNMDENLAGNRHHTPEVSADHVPFSMTSHLQGIHTSSLSANGRASFPAQQQEQTSSWPAANSSSQISRPYKQQMQHNETPPTPVNSAMATNVAIPNSEICTNSSCECNFDSFLG